MVKKDKDVISKKNVTKKCFFITPIGEESSVEYKKLKGLVENVITPVLSNMGYEIDVAHKINKLGSIGDQIFSSIIGSDLIISNLTDWNPNVMYETAVAHSFGIPTIMICEIGPRLPFDLIGDRVVFFEDSINGSGVLSKQLEDKISNLEEDKTIDNPVFRSIKDKDTISRVVESADSGDQVSKMLVKMSEDITSLSNKFDNLDVNNDLNLVKKIHVYLNKEIYLDESEIEDEVFPTVIETIEKMYEDFDIEYIELDESFKLTLIFNSLIDKRKPIRKLRTLFINQGNPVNRITTSGK
ncbi:hypothetical protein I6N95_25635 [Vagococcus sp. BWB3-3]|uniref:Nucleoside 2-deoxyribosyltransferase n=1 Tax=Vagococcus allomyrinae TaxID=2794353 RepID=A0A940PGE6_9ENTE|nr:hypothetical protein [Vagococcus allomyrinae]MBP1044395.1 hypothetical protein [Vagococcus allomyrinae]